MPSIHSIINKTIKKNRPAEILTVFYNGIFDFELAKTNNNFYGILGNSSINWDNLDGVNIESKPDNIHFIQNFDRYDFDLIIVNDREKNIETIQNYEMYFQLPIIAIDHKKPTLIRNKFILNKATPEKVITVAVDEEVQKACGSIYCLNNDWDWNKIINHCKDSIWLR